MLKSDIGLNAGTIWGVLAEQGPLTIKEIVEVTGYKESLVTLSLGWLSRENKVSFHKKKEKIYVDLAHSFSENYY